MKAASKGLEGPVLVFGQDDTNDRDRECQVEPGRPSAEEPKVERCSEEVGELVGGLHERIPARRSLVGQRTLKRVPGTQGAGREEQVGSLVGDLPAGPSRQCVDGRVGGSGQGPRTPVAVKAAPLR